jgi:hypothetical protein
MQVSKALYAEFLATQKKKKPFKGLGLEHLNGPCHAIPGSLDKWLGLHDIDPSTWHARRSVKEW